MKEPPAEGPSPDVGGLVRISVIDSHTGGEPTRVITGGFPVLSGRTVAERRVDLMTRYERLVRLMIAEPRGHEAMVAALLVPPDEPDSLTGVIFFDRAGVIGMCGHGTIGLVETFRHLARIGPGTHRIDTAVGRVEVTAAPDGRVTVQNVPSRRLGRAVRVDVMGIGEVVGDVAYGGNTFFLVTSPFIDLDQPVGVLLSLTKAILAAVHRAGFRTVDHIELYGPPTRPEAHSRNFVLCPSGTYDRSPCGTGTSAKVACLAADRQLSPGEEWVQESITGSVFTARYLWHDSDRDEIIPFITGYARVLAESDIIFHQTEIIRR